MFVQVLVEAFYNGDFPVSDAWLEALKSSHPAVSVQDAGDPVQAALSREDGRFLAGSKDASVKGEGVPVTPAAPPPARSKRPRAAR